MFLFAKKQRYSLDADDLILQRRLQWMNMQLHSFTRVNEISDEKTTKNTSQTLTQLSLKDFIYSRDQ